MTNISDPNATEMRGWVMLMLERAAENVNPSECNDPAVLLACSLGSDSCPAACQKDIEEPSIDENGNPVVVKSGDLQVSASAATERKAIISGNVSDLDTITLVASEKITVNSITLERFGYSTADDVDSIWLEDAYGNKIADEKSLSTSKDTVVLKIKKEYRDMDESNSLTIVLKTSNTAKAGGTIGFKVTEVDATAKNLNLADYNPYTYDLVAYDGSKVKVTVKGNEKKYNYEEGEFYEVSRIKVQAGKTALSLNGITLTNDGAYTGTETTSGGAHSVLDLDDFVSNVKVTVDGKDVSGLKFNVTKDNELVLSWDEIEVAINKDVQIIVSIAMENLDEFGKYVRLVLKEKGDLKATEKKTGARITVTSPEPWDLSWKAFQFNGGKVKFTNTKLSSTIDAAQGSENVVIAKGSVSVPEEIKITKLVFTATTGVINNMSLRIAGEVYDASVSPDKKSFTFTNVFIEKSGDFELNVDIRDDEKASGEEVTIKFNNSSTSIGKAIFSTPANNGRYEGSREYVKDADVSGSIAISKLKVQESKGSLTNKQTQKRNIVVNENKDEVIFDGEYIAKKGTVYLDNVKIELVSGSAQGSDINFTVTINGQDVADIDNPSKEGDDVDFYPIEVADGKSVSVKVVAHAYAEAASTKDFEYKITLMGKDNKNNDAGKISKTMAKIAFVGADSVTVSTSSANEAKKQDLVLAADNQIISWFVVEPDKKSSEATIDDVVFDITSLFNLLSGYEDGAAVNKWADPDNYFDFVIGKDTADDMKFSGDASKLELIISDMGAKITSKEDAKLTFQETLTASDDDYVTVLTKVNNDVQTDKEFTRRSVNALVKVAEQRDQGSETEYRFSIEYSDDATNKEIAAVTFTYDVGSGVTFTNVTEGWNGYTAKNIKDETRYVTNINYTGSSVNINVPYATYTDFFKISGKRLQAFPLK